MLKFITGNKNKFREVSQILAPIKIKQVKLNLPEIQDLDAHKVILFKLTEALKHEQGPFIVEDDSVYFDCLNGQLPGPLIRWFNGTIGNKGMLKMVKGMGNNKVSELVLFGYAKNRKSIKFFEGLVHGEFVRARGKSNFGFDPIFQPKSNKKTYAEMPEKEKHSVSARGIAAGALKNYLLKNAGKKLKNKAGELRKNRP